MAMWLWFINKIIIIFNFIKKLFIVSNKLTDSNVLYRSSNYLIINKPYDMVVNSNNSKVKKTLENELKKMFPHLANPLLKNGFYFVHRLDYPTSGVICIALNKNSARAASTAFEKRKVKKYYLALVHGHINESHLIINKPIGQDTREILGNKKMCTIDDNHCIKPRDSCTLLLVLERGLRDGKPATKILLRPHTGRRHQLRVHCYYIGHTIIGDYTYSDRKDSKPHRTFLHSFRLALDNEIEKFDVRTSDPFNSNDYCNKWAPTNLICTLNNNTFDIIDKLI
ncbi:RNA pseudouridylate synthase domain-containing protein 1 [Microplitis demolitor]|uniref:RNA pseudouridylate synthase domain-containing protein 1 n=1 Tax=Microplitis demolitor TaxID=69319 RepID=UPI0006D52285|nr:RNA pseudouridylate synthase domain-containing protein 1 [Microplitis demolitor]